jgi:hypothetical protein
MLEARGTTITAPAEGRGEQGGTLMEQHDEFRRKPGALLVLALAASLVGGCAGVGTNTPAASTPVQGASATTTPRPTATVERKPVAIGATNPASRAGAIATIPATPPDRVAAPTSKPSPPTRTPVPRIGTEDCPTGPVRPPARPGLLVPVGGTCSISTDAVQRLRQLADTYEKPYAAKNFAEAAEAAKKALPDIERAVEADQWCVELLVALVRAYFVEVDSHCETSLNCGGAVIPVMAGHTRSARAALDRYLDISAPNDTRRAAAEAMKQSFTRFQVLEEQLCGPE